MTLFHLFVVFFFSSLHKQLLFLLYNNIFKMFIGLIGSSHGLLLEYSYNHVIFFLFLFLSCYSCVLGHLQRIMTLNSESSLQEHFNYSVKWFPLPPLASVMIAITEKCQVLNYQFLVSMILLLFLISENFKRMSKHTGFIY